MYAQSHHHLPTSVNYQSGCVSVQPMPRGDHVLNFSDVEDKLKDEDLKSVLLDSVSYACLVDWVRF